MVYELMKKPIPKEVESKQQVHVPFVIINTINVMSYDIDFYDVDLIRFVFSENHITFKAFAGEKEIMQLKVNGMFYFPKPYLDIDFKSFKEIATNKLEKCYLVFKDTYFKHPVISFLENESIVDYVLFFKTDKKED